jgi:hypothetical protein
LIINNWFLLRIKYFYEDTIICYLVDHSAEKFEGDSVDHSAEKFEGYLIDHSAEKFEGDLLDHSAEKFEGGLIERLNFD